MKFCRHAWVLVCLLALHRVSADEPAWTKAANEKGPLTVAQAKIFMKTLAEHALEHHMKKKAGSEQRGMMYEYLCWKKRGQPDQFVQGEALDTMHDGAWFACAMASAYRATGQPYYKEVLVKWQLPFYLKMLNESEKLFSNQQLDVRPENKDLWKNSKEWLLQGRESGFVPYWWDDGDSISIDMVSKKDGVPFYPCTNRLAGKSNPEFRLDGFSHGSSNHLAQDLGVLLVQAWLTLKDSDKPEERAFLPQLAEAAKHLEECRTRHGAPNIPAVLAAVTVCTGDESAQKRLPSWDKELPLTKAKNAFLRAKVDFKPGEKVSTPGFADDQEYLYYAGLAKHHSLPRPLAYQLTFDAYSIPQLYAEYCDDAPVPPGINRFDLYTFSFVDGKPEHLRSQRKGPGKTPIPVGSRLGPQNMAVCGWALQAIHEGGEYADIPEQVSKEVAKAGGKKLEVKAWLERELGCGLRTWEAIFQEYGYIPSGIGKQRSSGGELWEEYSDTGGYAHLINAAAQWIMYQEGKADWKQMDLGK